MKPCILSRKNRVSARVALAMFFLYGCVIFCGTLLMFHYAAQEASRPPLVTKLLTAFLLSSPFVAYGVFQYIIATREYSVDACGITIYYLKRFKQRAAWAEVSEISLCDVYHAPSNPEIYTLSLRIVIGSELKRAPIIGTYDRWRQNEYELQNYKYIINIEYDHERLEEICQYSGRTITDLRTDYVKERTQHIILNECTPKPHA